MSTWPAAVPAREFTYRVEGHSVYSCGQFSSIFLAQCVDGEAVDSVTSPHHRSIQPEDTKAHGQPSVHIQRLIE